MMQRRHDAILNIRVGREGDVVPLLDTRDEVQELLFSPCATQLAVVTSSSISVFFMHQGRHMCMWQQNHTSVIDGLCAHPSGGIAFHYGHVCGAWTHDGSTLTASRPCVHAFSGPQLSLSTDRLHTVDFDGDTGSVKKASTVELDSSNVKGTFEALESVQFLSQFSPGGDLLAGSLVYARLADTSTMTAYMFVVDVHTGDLLVKLAGSAGCAEWDTQPSWAFDSSIVGLAGQLVHFQDGSISTRKLTKPEEVVIGPISFHMSCGIVGFTCRTGEQAGVVVCVDVISGQELLRVAGFTDSRLAFFTRKRRALVSRPPCSRAQVWDLDQQRMMYAVDLSTLRAPPQFAFSDTFIIGTSSSSFIGFFEASSGATCLWQGKHVLWTKLAPNECSLAFVSEGTSWSPPWPQSYEVALLKLC